MYFYMMRFVWFYFIHELIVIDNSYNKYFIRFFEKFKKKMIVSNLYDIEAFKTTRKTVSNALHFFSSIFQKIYFSLCHKF